MAGAGFADSPRAVFLIFGWRCSDSVPVTEQGLVRSLAIPVAGRASVGFDSWVDWACGSVGVSHYGGHC